MNQEFGTREWVATHAVAIETSSKNKAGDIHGKPGASIMTDVFLMILCKAFLSSPPSNDTKPEDMDSE